MAEFRPKFLEQNYINNVAHLTLGVDGLPVASSLKSRIFDRNTELPVTLTGASENYTIDWRPSANTSVSRIILQGINWQDFIIYSNYPSSPTTLFDTTVSGPNSSENLYIEFSPTTQMADGTALICIVSGLIPGSGAFRVSEWIITNEIFEFSQNMQDTIRVIPETAQFLKRLSDGSSHKDYVRKILNYQLTLVGATSANSVPSGSDYEGFREAFDHNRRQPLIFVPYPRTAPDIFDGRATPVHWVSDESFHNWTNGQEVNGFDGLIDLRQA